MVEEFEKKDIVIHIQPYTATVVVGLLRSYLETITEHFISAGEEMNVPLSSNFYPEAKEVLDEIYEKCIVHTDVRERTEAWKEAINLAGGKLPGGKRS